MRTVPLRTGALCALIALLSGCGSSDSAAGADQTAPDLGTGGAGTGGATGGAGAGGSAIDAGKGGAGAGGSAIDAGKGGGGAGNKDAGAGGTVTDASTEPDSTPAGGGLDAGLSTARPLGTTSAGNGFWEYLPLGYGDGVLRPLLVFWHGIGENGSGSLADLAKVPNNGPPKLIKANQWPEARPFVVLSPQHAGSGCPSDTEIHDFITFALATYVVDPGRVYLTGLSCGAIGSAQYLAKYIGQQVVASVLIAGDATPIWNTNHCAFLTDVALWAFHGDADPTVSINGDNTVMPQFIACPAPHKDVQYTVYPGVGHDSWTRTYDLSAGHDIYAWMLGFNR